jgi:hypothetical protein
MTKPIADLIKALKELKYHPDRGMDAEMDSYNNAICDAIVKVKLLPKLFTIEQVESITREAWKAGNNYQLDANEIEKLNAGIMPTDTFWDKKKKQLLEKQGK